MTTKLSLLEDQLVDMAFITKLLQMTDKWMFKLIKDGTIPQTDKAGTQLSLATE